LGVPGDVSAHAKRILELALGHFRSAFDVPVPRVFTEFLSGMAIGLSSTGNGRAMATG
jgi:hypothetical protein